MTFFLEFSGVDATISKLNHLRDLLSVEKVLISHITDELLDNFLLALKERQKGFCFCSTQMLESAKVVLKLSDLRSFEWLTILDSQEMPDCRHEGSYSFEAGHHVVEGGFQVLDSELLL